jgi:outer membrane biosynthesis protein TonB
LFPFSDGDLALLMHIPALQEIRKVKDNLGRCHDEHGYLTSCSTSSSGPGQRSLADFGGTPKEGNPTPAPEPASEPGDKPADKPAASIDIKAQRTSSGIKYSSSGATLYTSKDSQGDRIISGIRFSKDPKETAGVIERALKDGPIAIPINIAQSPGGSKALHELHQGGKIREDSASKPGHTIIRPAGGEGWKSPEPKPAPKPEPKPESTPARNPEPKPEPKPDPKPAGSEVHVTTNGAWTSYKLGDKVHISVAQVQGGGRVLMGSNFAPHATTDDVAVAMYRVVKTGPLTFPDRMFANQKFREAIQNLVQLSKVVLTDSSNGRDKILYEAGPDGKPVDRRPPEAKPTSESPRRHPTNTDARVLPEFTPARSTAEAVKRLAQHMSEGAARVEYEGLPIEKMNSILKASEHVLGKYGVEVKQMGFCQKKGAEYGYCAANLKKEVLYVQLRKSFVSDPQKYVKRDIGRMRANQAYNIIRTEKYINDLKTNPRYQDRPGYEGAVDSEIKRHEKKLEHLKNVDHWIVADAVEDPVYAIQAHECMHAVYFYHNLAPKFTEEMDKVGGWSIPLTEYATSKKSEFFAELGSAITCGYKVDPKLFEAFQNTVRSIQ